jgi:phage head maturation protease
MAIEHKILEAQSVKMDATGSGSITAYDSVFYELDDGADIVMPGAYKRSLPAFLERGFGTKDHEWSYDGAISFPVAASEDNYGLKTTFAFHSTPDAQAIRVKAQERMDAGLKVFKSIGYETMEAEVIFQPQFEERLKGILPADKYDLAIAKAQAKGFQKVRLLQDVELYESATVVVPMLKSAEATGVKAATETQATGEVVVSETTVEDYADGADLPLKPAMEVVMKALEKVISHAESRKEVHKKEGRRFSSATVETLQGLRAQIDSLLDEGAVEEPPADTSDEAAASEKAFESETIELGIAAALAELELMKMSA